MRMGRDGRDGAEKEEQEVEDGVFCCVIFVVVFW